MPSKPLVIQLTKAVGAYPKGAELGVDKASDADKLFEGAYKITGYQDGSAYEPPAPPAEAPAATEPDNGKGA